ncbi:MAG: NAD(P)/FAD-dependent oxidoreductase [Anaerolineales bacterium]|nr:NAD(P)/FAD-dependent oxidoreductase [Anaerolineales bacterium]
MSKQYEVIVVGAGHNGLLVAGYLAKAGLKVCVLEKKSRIGGSTSTEEATLPGFKHDLGGTMHSAIQGNPVIANDELGLIKKYGLEYVYPDITAANVFDDDTAVVFWHSVDQTCQEIAKFSERDAVAYKQFIEYALPMMPLLGSGMYNAPPAFGQMIAQLDQNPAGRELIRFMTMSAWDVATQWFEHPKTMLMALKLATEPMVGCEEKGTGVYLLLSLPAHHVGRAGFPKGGSQALPDSLARCIQANGGDVLTNQDVVTIKTQNGRATGVITAGGEEYSASRAVVSNVDPRISLIEWLDTPLSSDLQGKLQRILEPSFSGMMQAIALNEAPNYKAGGACNDAVVVEPLPTSVEDFRRMFDDLRYGIIPQKGLAPFVVCPTLADPSRAPEGKHVLYLWHYMPYNLKNGGHQAWTEVGQQAADTVLDYFSKFTTNMGPDNILKRTIITPHDYPKWNNNLVNAGIVGFGAFLSQSYAYRPIPEMGQYRTPVQGLYLSGQSAHPGGAIIGGGRATAQIMCQDLGIDFDDIIDV